MSHFKERKEKICLNCNADLHGRFCHKCGQENREPKSTVWGLITHFFYDITHFDGKFFSTTGKLISRPGFLPKEYIRGRRASYLDPIRMYVFSSAIFFLFFFGIFNVGDVDDSDQAIKETRTALEKAKPELLKNIPTKEDSLLLEKTFSEAQAQLDLAGEDSIITKDSTANSQPAQKKKKKGNSGKGWKFSLTDVDFKTKEAYDSAQRALPANKRDNWLERRIELRAIELNQRVEKDANQFWKDAMTKFVHSFPYLLFVSLPLYALYLKLLYIRRKKYYYVDHGLFLIFLYIFTFIFLLVFVGIDELGEATGWEWIDYILVGMFFWGIYYAWRAMHKFYEQGRFKTFLKFALFNLLCLASLILLFGLFFTLTVLSI